MTTFDKIVAPTPRELFIGQIIRKILSGELKSGEKLPPERELAEQMDMNRSAVHTALDELQRMGFVSVEPRRGIFIADYANDGDFNTLNAIAKYTGGQLSSHFRVDLVELRNAIVGASLIRISRFGSDEDIRGLREMVERHRLAAAESSDLKSAAGRMLEFNLEIARVSGNKLNRLLMNTMGPASSSIWESCVSFWGVETELRQEDMLVSLLEKRQGHEAALYLEKQFDTVSEEKGLRK